MGVKRARTGTARKNWLEWTVFTAGLVLVLVLLGYLTAEAVAGRSGPASIEIQLGTPLPGPAGHVVPVKVFNRGAEAVSDLEVEVTLVPPRAPEERNRLTIPLLPGGATQEGWVVFRDDPRRAERMDAHPIRYRQP